MRCGFPGMPARRLPPPAGGRGESGPGMSSSATRASGRDFEAFISGDLQAHLIRPDRKGEPARFGKLARRRQRIEAIIYTSRAPSRPGARAAATSGPLLWSPRPVGGIRGTQRCWTRGRRDGLATVLLAVQRLARRLSGLSCKGCSDTLMAGLAALSGASSPTQDKDNRHS